MSNTDNHNKYGGTTEMSGGDTGCVGGAGAASSGVETTNTGAGATSSGINRQYKDRLFRALFGSPERKHLTLQLYNAMNGSSYTNPNDIELSTIDDVVYMGMKNDVSFLFDKVMNLWEQQSTPNRNMPLRLLFYYTHVTERYVKALDPEDGSIYSNRPLRLPGPRMVMFYNGPGELPEYLYLSDIYPDDPDPDVTARVRVININTGQSPILEHCCPLQDYSTYTETFRRYRLMGNISDRDAASKAIADLRPGEVKDYLIAHESEVLDMLLTEYDEEKTLKAIYYDGEQTGLEKGLKQGLQQGLEQGIQNSLRMLYDLVADGELSMTAALKRAADYGIADETEFRARAAEHGVQLPD